VASVVELFGTMPQPMRALIKNLPATLIVHGRQDQVVPVAEAEALHQGLVTAKRPCACLLYDTGHVFATSDGKMTLRGLVQMADAEGKIGLFLDRRLKPAVHQE
jgi:esterase/lipase